MPNYKVHTIGASTRIYLQSCNYYGPYYKTYSTYVLPQEHHSGSRDAKVCSLSVL